MSSKKSLRVVQEGDEKPRKLSVSEAADSGDHLALLISMRDRISRTVSDPDCPPRDLASLTRRLQDIAKEIESIEASQKQEAESRGIREAADGAFDAQAI